MKHRWWDSEVSKDVLKRGSVRGGLDMLAAQLVKFILNVFVTTLLAHILIPEDFGLIAMVMVVVNFLVLFKDAGFSAATVQQQEVTHEQVSLLFWLNATIGIMLGGILYFATPWLVSFFHDERLFQVVPVLAWVFVVGGLGIQHEALMRRQMRFRSLMFAEVLGLVMASLLAVYLAYDGQGYWAMVWMQVAAIVVRVMLLWVFAGWLPSLPMLKVGVRSMVAFGAHLTLANVVQYLSRQSDQFMLGHGSGAHALGLYSTAMQMLMLPIRQVLAPLAPVAQVALSRTHLNPNDFRRVYGLLLMFIGYASMPLMAVLAVLAEPVVYVFLGEHWREAVPIVRILAATGWILAVNNTMGWILMARGQGGRMLRWNMMMAPFLILGFAAGLSWGAEGVAWGFFIVIYLTRWPHFRYTLQGSGIALLDMWIALRWPMALSAVLALMAACVVEVGGSWGAWQVLLASVMFNIALIAGMVCWFSPIRQQVKEVWSLLQEARA